MSELSSEARALVSDGRGVLRPTAQDRARVASRLSMRLGAVALLAAEPAYSAPRVALASKLTSVVAALGLVGAGAAYSLTQSTESAVVAPARAAVVQAGMTLPRPVSPPSLAPEPSALEAPTPIRSEAPPLGRKEPNSVGLSEEVALLSRATSQLRGGDAVGALASLELHQRRFPAGRLVEERLSASAQALCALGRRGEGRAELLRLERSAPRSPHVARARRACGSD